MRGRYSMLGFDPDLIFRAAGGEGRDRPRRPI